MDRKLLDQARSSKSKHIVQPWTALLAILSSHAQHSPVSFGRVLELAVVLVAIVTTFIVYMAFKK